MYNRSDSKFPEFSCKEPDIGTYFNEKLKKDIKRFVNAAYVLYEDDELVGFFTLSQHSVKRNKKVRNKGHFKHVPATLLGQFAISDKFCGKTYDGVKYSVILLRHALDIHITAVDIVGSTALMLNPVNSEVKDKFYAKIGLFSDYPADNETFLTKILEKIGLRKKEPGYMFAKNNDILAYLNDLK
jgi:hypothetical protein